MNPLVLLLAGVGSILLGGIASLILAGRPRWGDLLLTVLAVTGMAACLVAGLVVLQTGKVAGLSFAPPVPGGLWVLALDPLSAWFLLLLCLVGIPATIYGATFLAPDRGRRPVAVAHALLTLLLAAMILVLASRAVVLFMLAWEVMALSACLLILYDGELREVRWAGLIYLVMTHLGALALLGMFLYWGRIGPDLTFGSLSSARAALPWEGTVILLLALLGFGGKAGMVPLHFWVPGADAAEPSHVSAVLSGVMLKMGIYGLFRVLTLVGAPPAWFGWALVVLGGGSGVLGVLWALGERDLKRVLAYSSVENVGIILLGMGVGVLGLAYGHPLMAVLGYTGALLHSLNHALSKSLLFLGAGAVLRATGTRVLDELGAVGRVMPWTAGAFGVGAVAILGVPPLNGFLSEWVVVQGLLAGARHPGSLGLLVLGVAGLGLVGGLAVACFSRVVGSVFLGQPRQAQAVVREDWGLVGPMLTLAGLCIGAGAVPALVLAPVTRVVALLAGETGPTVVLRLEAPVIVLGALVGVVGLGWVLRRFLARSRAAQQAPTWGGAYSFPAARMQYTAGSYSGPLRVALTGSGDPVLASVRPSWQKAKAIAAAIRPLHQGPITRYLQYIVLTVLVLLGALFVSLARQR